MLIEFSVGNYLSIKDKVTFTMEPTADKNLDSNIFRSKRRTNVPLLTIAAIYGANASGKSNFLNAFNFIRSLVQISHTFQPETKIPVVSFKLDHEYEHIPTSMEIIFINKGIKYRYGFDIIQEKVINEYLYAYKTRRPTLIFERKNTNNYRFTKDANFQKDITKKTGKNALYLSTSAQWNYEPSQNALNWFEEHFIVEIPSLLQFGTNKTCQMIIENRKNKEMILKSLQYADLGIFGIEVVEKESVQIDKDIPLILSTIIKMNKPFDIKFAHKGKKDGIDTTVHFNIDEESGGTKKYFQIIGQMIESLQEGDIVVMDEFDTSIHPLLLKKIMNMFLDPQINKKGAQLIFATHSTSLLDSDVLRRDQIWFTEKKDDGSTDLYSLADFPVRKNADFEKGYLLGRYGAIPYLPMGNII